MLKVNGSFVELKGLRFYAFHGVLPQERRVGGWFSVTLRVGYDWSRATKTDSVDDTLNYADLYRLVNHEMAVPSQLLEHVAGRIARSVEMHYPNITSLDLWVTKENPPIGADCQGATVELHAAVGS
jgi:dihydroneopterin aldolase